MIPGMPPEHPPQPDATPPPDSAREGDPLGDVLTAWTLAIAGAYLAWRLLPTPLDWIGAALAWSLVPVALANHRGLPLRELGIAWTHPVQSLLWTAGTAAVILPAFAFGYLTYHGHSGWVAPPPGIALAAFWPSLIRAGLPEELFFRGFVQSRLAARFPNGPRLLGAALVPIVGAAALFAVTHVVFAANPFSAHGLQRLLTFFPGLLFGLLRAKTGNLVAPAVIHALCNAWLIWLQAGYGS
jgi:membrane protease YdiL (CAAX protease family)